jgi:hypothetical protein
MNARACCLSSPDFNRPPIGKALTDNALDRFRRAFHIAYVKRHALIITEIELGKIALQMLLADMMVHAIDAAFKD